MVEEEEEEVQGGGGGGGAISHTHILYHGGAIVCHAYLFSIDLFHVLT